MIDEKFVLKGSQIKDLELPASAMTFDMNDEELNLIVGTTFGYLIEYKKVEENLLGNHVVLNNGKLQESIIDVVKKDLDNDGYQELIVFYFNKIVQFYRIQGKDDYAFLGEVQLKELFNIPFKLFLLENSESKGLFFFSQNHFYEYELKLPQVNNYN